MIDAGLHVRAHRRKGGSSVAPSARWWKIVCMNCNRASEYCRRLTLTNSEGTQLEWGSGRSNRLVAQLSDPFQLQARIAGKRTSENHLPLLRVYA